MTEPTDAGTPAADAAADVPQPQDATEAAPLFDEASVLADLQEQLQHVDGVELDRRPALLEQANAALVQALSDLEEV